LPAVSLATPHAAAPEFTRREVWTWYAAAAAVLAALFYLPHNGLWTPGGDSDAYTAIARNLVRGDGFTYNGNPVAICPIGWPAVLASWLWISPDFAFLKFMQATTLLVGTLLFYPILLHLTRPRTAAGTVALTGILYPVYPLSYWLHSEPLFLVVGNVAVLLALRVASQRGFSAGRIVMMAGIVGLLVAAVLIRWGGLLYWAVVAAALLAPAGRRWPDALAWTAALAGAAAAVAAFQLSQPPAPKPVEAGPTMYVISGDPTTKPTNNSGAGTTRPTTRIAATRPVAVEDAEVRAVPVVRQDNDALGHGPMLAQSGTRAAFEVAERVFHTGKWPAWTLWYPLRFGDSVPLAGIVATFVGWTAFGLFLVTTFRLVRRGGTGGLLLLGVAAYVAAWAVLWPNVNARYLVPIAPLLIFGVVAGVKPTLQMAGFGERTTRRMPYVVLASIFAANAGLWTYDTIIARTGDDYLTHYEGGDPAELAAAAAWLRRADVAPGEVAVSDRYNNLGRIRHSPAGPRAFTLLVDVPLVSVPKQLDAAPWMAEIPHWADRRGVRYYLYQQPALPWRLWHLRLPNWLHHRLAESEAPPTPTGGWQLWQMTYPNDGPPRMKLVEVEDLDEATLPDRVPGIR
jgi:hypothetical protein